MRLKLSLFTDLFFPVAGYPERDLRACISSVVGRFPDHPTGSTVGLIIFGREAPMREEKGDLRSDSWAG